MKNTDDLDENILFTFKKVFNALDISDYQIQTAIQDLSLPPLDFDTREQLAHDGLLAAENFADEMIELAEPYLYFKYKKRVVFLYQRDQFLLKSEYEKQKYRPFHLCFCHALRSAQEKNRYESRYVMTYNTGGNFKLNLFIRDKNSFGETYTEKKEQNVYKRLKVCQHCLRELNWEHFRSFCGPGLEWWKGGDRRKRFQIVDNFDFEKYILTARENNFSDHPVFGTASSTIKKEYVLLPQIKEELKKMCDYTCEICHEKFSSEELHIHHKNHNEGDNRRQNLKVVCVGCHALIHEAEGGFVSRLTAKNSIRTAIGTANNSSEKYRIFELEKEFNVSSQEMIDFLKTKKIYIANKFSAINSEAYEILKGHFKCRIDSFEEYVETQKKLGEIYLHGWGVDVDTAKAKKFYSNAIDGYKILAEKGSIHAKYELANLYLNGYGFGSNLFSGMQILAKQMFVHVFKVYSSAVSNNPADMLAKIRLGIMYAKGLGVPKNLEAAKKIVASIRKDIKFVDSELVNLFMITGNMDEALKLYAKAFQLFEIAANSGDSDSALELRRLIDLKIVKTDIDLSNKLLDTGKIEQQIKAFEETYMSVDEKLISDVKNGDADSILELRKLSREGNKKADEILKTLYYDGNKEHAVGTVVLPDYKKSISDGEFKNCTDLKAIVIPNSVTSIGDNAFENCSNLIDIKMTNSVTYIGNNAFANCSSLKEIIIPQSVRSIRYHTFEDCINLVRVIIPNSVTLIHNGAFHNCNKLKEIVITNSVTYIGKGAFRRCSSLTNITFPNSITYIDEDAFYNCALKNIIYGKDAENILKEYFGWQWEHFQKTVMFSTP